MNGITINATPLYTFLKYCQNSSLEKKILDCGAGGKVPPLVLFQQYGYQTYGIDISPKRIQMANVFCQQNNLPLLNIIEGDIRSLPYEDNFMSFIYSFNTIFHLPKKDIKKVIQEIQRVLKPNGLCYLNFMLPDDDLYGEGQEIRDGEFIQKFANETVLHVFHSEEEAERLLREFKMLYKVKKNVTKKEWDDYHASYLEYIIKKPDLQIP
ncbi:MAG: class I SAM-dependent methyltransferase [Asgard group archaeon]|nr:class I SAM-dependent methyltransferase [Asgard group archaeon]